MPAKVLPSEARPRRRERRAGGERGCASSRAAAVCAQARPLLRLDELLHIGRRLAPSLLLFARCSPVDPYLLTSLPANPLARQASPP